PKAAEIVLVLSARDTLLVDVPLPPVTGVKLRRSLPHVVEEYLVDDPQHSHVAVGPVVANDAPSAVAVVDRARFGAVIDWFVAAGWRRIRAVPLVHCMPPVVVAEADEATESAGAEAPGSDAEALATAGGEADVLIVGRSASAASDGDAGAQWLELAVKHGASGFGIETHVAALDVAIAELSKRQPVRVHALTLGTRDGGAD
ncbi:hypothetical protein G3N57_37210, partial [Paraburkholderia sp. Se-20369]|nr:hypothetical protein [Paraburkholderia sp. Se-20369]